MNNNILEIFKNKKVRYGGYAAIVTLIVLVALVVLNLLVQQIPAELDMTHNKLYSLSKETTKLVEGLKNPVTIYALYRPGQQNQSVVDVLQKYQHLSGKLHVEYIDPDKNPGLVAKYDKDNKGIAAGSLIITSGNYTRTLSPYDLYDISYTQQGQPQILGFTMEQKVTGAIAYVSSGIEPKIYELTGHGEKSLLDLQLTTTLNRDNYQTAAINLLSAPSVPTDASAVVVVSPKFDITKDEENKLLSYIQSRHGRVMFFFDYLNKPLPEALPNFNDLLSSFGVGLQEGFVVEEDRSHFVNSPLTIIPSYGTSDILKPLESNNLSMIVQDSVGIKTLAVKRRDIKIVPLLTTSKSSFVRVDVSDNSPNRLASDVKGPVDIAVSVEQETNSPDKGFRLIVAGNGSFLGPIFPFGSIKGNIEFFLNALNWVSSQPTSLNIPSKSLFQLPLQMSQLLIYLYMGIVIILIPAVILGIGIATWLRRRHL